MNSIVRNISAVRDVSSDDFRTAMRHLAGGVSIITAGRGKEITGAWQRRDPESPRRGSRGGHRVSPGCHESA